MPGSDGDILNKPTRLRLPKAKAVAAKSPFIDGFVIPDTTPVIRLIPVVQWHQMRLRVRITGAAGVIGFQFARPARQRNPDQASALGAFLYTVDQPAINGTAWVDGVELGLEVTGAEHHGENWVALTLTAAGACVVDFCDLSGDLHGQST